ncbi:MAG: purine-nucleoside phosphorylase [Saprospiraceae bacterium]|nr:purine-nucleoside phosphorylase [Saprospiraceae bacterium]
MEKETFYNNIEQSANYIRKQIEGRNPATAIMTGTGLSSIIDDLTHAITIDYKTIPHFPQSTVQSHRGKLVCGKLNGTEVLILAGRWHYYEGYSTKELTIPIRVVKHLGIENILFTNVSGSVNENYKAGDLVIIKDHINFIPDHPLRGYNDLRLGPRFPDMLHTYDVGIREKINHIATDMGHTIHEGVYFALQGPSLETPAEYNFIHIVGADMVGMSTVPEVIVAKHTGLKIGAVSIISNVCYPPEKITETTIEEVIEVAHSASKKLNEVLTKVVSEI